MRPALTRYLSLPSHAGITLTRSGFHFCRVLADTAGSELVLICQMYIYYMCVECLEDGSSTPHTTPQPALLTTQKAINGLLFHSCSSSW